VTGLDHIDLAACEARGVRVVSLRGEVEFLKNVRATAELNLGLAIALMRHIPSADQSVKQGHWNRDLFRGNELFGKTAGIVGVGRLGSILSRYLSALGMTVLGFDPKSDFSDSTAERIGSLERLLNRSDVVFLLVSYDQSTHHLIGQQEFAAMRKGAFLINTSRGGVVDERAMLAALQTGHLAGVGLDVLDGEPLIDETHPVVAYARENSRVVIVPHIGGNSHESFEKTEVFLALLVVEQLSHLRNCPTSRPA
jgi:D-3-phosphoglycerate dehydrogenase